MTITLCNSHPFTFYLPFHTSLRADQCPIQSHVPSTCTLGLDPCARHSLFGRTDPYYIDNFYSSCGLKRLAATLASPLLCNCTVLPVPLSTGPYLGLPSLIKRTNDTIVYCCLSFISVSQFIGYILADQPVSMFHVCYIWLFH